MHPTLSFEVAASRAEEARQEGTEFLERAKEEADRVLSTLSSRRETLVDQLQLMQSRLLGVASELESVIVPAVSGEPDPGCHHSPPCCRMAGRPPGRWVPSFRDAVAGPRRFRVPDRGVGTGPA